MLRMTVPYTKWLTISRGSSTEKSPAFSNLVKLSASDETVGFIDEPTAVTDRYAVLTPKHHPVSSKVLPGLVTRRAAEQKMFLQGGAADIAALLLGVMMAGAAVLVAMIFMM